MKQSITTIEGINILDFDATEIAKMIANKEISSIKVTELFIEHIKKMNPALNFMVEERFTSALEEAKEADWRISEGTAKGRLFGVPISMKESFHVTGMQTTGGLLRRKGFIQDEDASIVMKLKAEGAIILCKTNTPELCFCQETDNKLYGRTNNPWDASKTVGGSSGGEAALIVIGGASAGIGSDIGGSIRFPSHFNGVIGFKSGKGQVSSEGSYPVEEHALQKRMLGIGPITKTVRDAKLLYSIIAEEQVRENSLDSFTINVLPETNYPLSKSSKALLNSIYQRSFEQLPTERVIPPFFNESSLIWQEIMSINGAAGTVKEAFGDKPATPYRSYITELINGKSEIHRYLSWGLIGTSLFKPSEKRVKGIEDILFQVDQKLDEYLNERILVFPVYHSAAPLHGVVYKEIFSIKKSFKKFMPYVAYANVWGLPSLTIPVGIDETGMPIGVQLMSKNGNEDALFTLGEWMEEHFRGYVRMTSPKE